VDVKNQVASIDRMSNVEDGIEVGQDNLGMDSVDEESVATKEKHSGIIFNLKL
jgi:soluble P-type ATPase